MPLQSLYKLHPNCRFTVAEWLTHMAAMQVTGSMPSFGDISDIRFLESIQSPAQRDLNGLCDIAEFIVTCDVGGD